MSKWVIYILVHSNLEEIHFNQLLITFTGKCLKSVGIIADDSRDEFKKHRFLALPPKHYLIPGSLPKDFWWWQYIRYPQKPVCNGSIMFKF